LTAEPRAQAKKIEYVFLLDPVLGLTDIDFHPITDEGWQYMRSPEAPTTAGLVVSPRTTVEAIEQALQLLLRKGNYQSVQITVGNP
jgi:hypothetical protein